MIKKLRDIVEKYPDNYEQKTEVARSFVAMHKGGKIDKLGSKGATENQFNADNVKVADHPRQSDDAGFPGEGEYNDYNLRTYYDKSDAGGSDEYDDDDFEYDDNDVDNDETRSRIANDEEYIEEDKDEDEDKEKEYVKLPPKKRHKYDPELERNRKRASKIDNEEYEIQRMTFPQLMEKWIIDEAMIEFAPIEEAKKHKKRDEYEKALDAKYAKIATPGKRGPTDPEFLNILKTFAMRRYDLMNKLNKEETEQLDEISARKLRAYAKGARRDIELTAEPLYTDKDAGPGTEKENRIFNRMEKREKGIDLANKKLRTKRNEEIEQLDEMMTRKHFRSVANTVRAIEDPKKRWEYASHHAEIFAKDNPRFDRQKFFDAAGTRNPLDISTSKKGK